MSIESNIFWPGLICITVCVYVPTVMSHVMLEMNLNLEVFNLTYLLYRIPRAEFIEQFTGTLCVQGTWNGYNKA